MSKYNQINYSGKFTIRPVLQRFVLDQSIKDELKVKKPEFGFNGLGEVVFRRTYSRDNEDWYDVVVRVIEGVMSIRKEHFYRNSLEWNDSEWQSFARDMAMSMFDMEWLPPGRGLWMMGTEFCYTRGSMALNNCAATDTTADLVHSAEWTMDALMNGVGVGFSTYWRGEATKPNKEDTISFTIPDTREGWVESLIYLMCSYIDSPKYGKNKFPKFDYSKIRAAGLPIRGFGGLSSGPAPLMKLHKRVEEYLDQFCDGECILYENYQLKDTGKKKPYTHTRLVADIFNAIGACVVAGNVRRSAEICLGDVSDDDFINLKNYKINPERGEIGWMSNNSIVLHENYDFKDFDHIPDMAARIRDNGEPGMINLYNIQKFGRYGKVMEDNANLVNPCFAGDTKISVADGRGYVTIKELAEEGKDVPVYSMDPISGTVSVKWARNPRITGEGEELLRVHFDNGTYLDVTPNHKFFLNSGKEIEACMLEKGHKIPKFDSKKVKPEKIHDKLVNFKGTTMKICETCKQSFTVLWKQREICYCDTACYRKKRNGTKIKTEKQSISFTEKLPGKHTVYNITVEDNHTLAIVTKSTNKKLNQTGIFTFNCGEIALNGGAEQGGEGELCNLSETFPPRCKTPENFYNAIKYATFYSSTVSLLPTHRSGTNAIIAKNRRIGVSVSGIAQWATMKNAWGDMNYTKMTKYLREGYKIVRKENKKLADAAGVPASIRVTTVKPSGSISLLTGVTPGVHYPVSRYAIRRMRIGMDSPLVEPMIKAKIPYEKDKYSDNTLVFEFIVDHGEVRQCDEVSPWEQFSLVAMMQRCWADNCVSATIYFDKEKDGPDVEKMLAMYIPILKSVSMLPHNKGVYEQAPYEQIDKKEYEERLNNYTIPKFENVTGNVPEGSKYCTGDTCEL